MNKPVNISKVIPHSAGAKRSEYFNGLQPALRPVFRLAGVNAAIFTAIKKMLSVAFFLLMPLKAGAPDIDSLIIPDQPAVNPFSKLMNVVGMVETSGNTLAFNELEGAAGVFQIRQVRIDEYNRRTGSNLALTDMFDYDLSKKVFLYFASLIGPYDFERIAKAWNGSGPMTELYWKRIRELL